MALTTPTILDDHFDGLRNLTRGNSEDTKDLATIIQAIAADLSAIETGTEIDADAISEVQIISTAMDTTTMKGGSGATIGVKDGGIGVEETTPIDGTTVKIGDSIDIPIPVPGSSTNDVDVSVPAGMTLRIVDAKFYNKGLGTASDTLQVKRVLTGPAVTAITDAMDANIADKTIGRASEIDHAYNEIVGAATSFIRVSQVDGGGADCPAALVTVKAQRIA